MNIPEPIHTMLEVISGKCLETRTKMLNMLAAAFLESTGLKPEDCELVEQVRATEIVFFFRKRDTGEVKAEGWPASGSAHATPTADLRELQRKTLAEGGLTVVAGVQYGSIEGRPVIADDQPAIAFNGSTPLLSTTAGRKDSTPTPAQE